MKTLLGSLAISGASVLLVVIALVAKSPAMCPGDCNEDGSVTIEEVVSLAQRVAPCGLADLGASIAPVAKAAEAASSCTHYVLEQGSSLTRGGGTAEPLSGSLSVLVSTDHRENVLFRLTVVDVRMRTDGGDTVTGVEEEHLGCFGAPGIGCIAARTIPIPFRMDAVFSASVDGSGPIVFYGGQELHSLGVPDRISDLVLCGDLHCDLGGGSDDVVILSARRME